MKSVLRSPASLLLLSSLCVGCAEDAEPNEPSEPHRLSATAEASIVCDRTNQVVLLPSASPEASSACGDFPYWDGEPLFASATAPSVLARYCRYTYSLGGATSGDVSDLLEDLPAGSESGTDCQAVTPQGEVITTTIGTQLDQFFGHLAGRVDGSGFHDAYPSATRSPVTTAVVDTYPSNEPGNPISSHGPVVMSIIERIACPQGTAGCDITVESVLGLPRSEDGLNHNNRGGVVGLQSDLARGVFQALESQRASSSGHQVINLSVGWESEHFGGSSLLDMPPPVRAVYDAIRMARCEGSLIIVAAGNSTGLTCDEEPLAPGRWEELPAPTAPECSGIGATTFVADTGNYRPLVHAVGGLFGANSEMPTSREFGMPRLAAAASHAVAHPRGDALPQIAVRTGTSIAAAVASAAASLVWSYRPGLSPAAVMDVLYSTGTSTPGTSDFGVETPVGAAAPVEVRRIDVCSAIEYVCGLAGSTCGPAGATPLDCDADSPVTLSGMIGLVEDLPPSVLKVRTADFDPTVQTCVNACGAEIEFHPYSGDSRSCLDTERRDPWASLTSPQPTKSGCSDCVLTTEDSDSSALLTVHSDFATDVLVAVDIVVVDDNDKIHPFSLKDSLTGTAPPLDRTKVASYKLPLDLSEVEPKSATVYMTFASGAETEDPMLLLKK